MNTENENLFFATDDFLPPETYFKFPLLVSALRIVFCIVIWILFINNYGKARIRISIQPNESYPSIIPKQENAITKLALRTILCLKLIV